MKKAIIAICDIVLYIIIFAVLQGFCGMGFNLLFKDDAAMALILGQAVSAIITIVLFALLHWTHFGLKEQKNTISLLLLVAIFALGTICPSSWLNELSGAEMPADYVKLFEQLMSSPWGYITVALLVPIAEEVVFRGAILRRLLEMFCPKSTDPETSFLKRYDQDSLHWTAIGISALLFALLHGNLAQGFHAFIMGLFLGWIYYRTNSILPGLIFHWVNNSAAVIISKVTNTSQDAKMIEVFGGNEVLMYSMIAVSTIVFIWALWRIAKAL